MLVSRVDKGDILAFKLVNGDEIIGKVEEITPEGFVLSRPCNVVPSQQGLGLIQSLFSANADKSVSLSKNHVIFYAPVIDQMESHYIQTTTGIAPITKGSIIT